MPGGMPGFPGSPDGMFGGSQSAGERFSVAYIEGENDEEIEKSSTAAAWPSPSSRSG